MARLVFDNISYSFGKGEQHKCVLHDISGFASANELTCIMGPSGSGKTSLLNALAGRIPALEWTKLTGTISYTGDYSSFRASYIMQVWHYLLPRFHSPLHSLIHSLTHSQDEILFDYLTVKETLQFSVYLNYENISNQVRYSFIYMCLLTIYMI